LVEPGRLFIQRLLAAHDYSCFYTFMWFACWILWAGIN
jgi:hypothetical protein